MPNIDPRLIIVFGWIIVCLVADLWLLLRPPTSLPRWPYMVIIALLVRLLPALILLRGAAYEMSLFEQTGRSLLAGENIYLGKLAHPYLPLQLYWLAAANILTDNLGISFTFWLKLPSIAVDTAMAVLIYRAVRRQWREEMGLRSGWLYALNPIVILVAAYQGQFDAVPLFFMIAAWYVFEFHSVRAQGLALSAGLLGFGILSKTWHTVLFPIVLLRLKTWKSKLGYLILGIAVPVVGILIYEAMFSGSWQIILRRAAGAGVQPGWWGYSSILKVMLYTM